MFGGFNLFLLLSFLYCSPFVGTIIYFGFFRGHAKEPTTPPEIAGRAVLIGTFSTTIFMFVGVFLRTQSIPDITAGLLTFNGLAVAIYVVLQLLASADASRESRIRLLQAQQKALEHPDNINYSWNLAAATLENYLDRNLSQVKWIFNIAVLVMISGFAILGYGVSLAMSDKVQASLATSASGLLTQFIGATFLVIYRSTMTQADTYVVILERLNNVGMAVQLFSEIPVELVDERNSARAEITQFLLASHKPKNMPITKSQSDKAPKPSTES